MIILAQNACPVIQDAGLMKIATRFACPITAGVNSESAEFKRATPATKSPRAEKPPKWQSYHPESLANQYACPIVRPPRDACPIVRSESLADQNAGPIARQAKRAWPQITAQIILNS